MIEYEQHLRHKRDYPIATGVNWLQRYISDQMTCGIITALARGSYGGPHCGRVVDRSGWTFRPKTASQLTL